MSESSVIEELVDQIKKSRKKGGSRSRSSRPKMKHSVTSSEAPISKSKSKSSKKGLFGGLLGDLGKNKMFLIGLAVLLVLAIGYYLMKKKKKKENNQNEEKNNNKEQLNDSHMEKVKEILQKREQYEKDNNIIKLKLPEKYLTDENGRPVILTPEVIQRIKNQPIHVNNQQNNQQTSRSNNQKRPSKKQVKQQRLEESEDYSDNDEDDNVQSQNLTKQEIEELKNQLEMMDSNIIPSNS
jgi:hypothetical protein